MKPGPVEESVGQRLLFSAAVVDVFVCSIFAQIISQKLERFRWSLEPELVVALVFLSVLVSYWVLTELFLAGTTIGRWSLGLHLRGQDGKTLRLARRIQRTGFKILFLGLNGLNPNKQSQYDRISGSRWLSEMAPPPPRPIHKWVLRVANGKHANIVARLASSRSFQSRQVYKIGRDPNWSDLKLTAEPSISCQHCIIVVRNNQLFIQDYGRGERGSSYGTFIHGRRIPAGKPVPIGNATYFRIANVRIDILR